MVESTGPTEYTHVSVCGLQEKLFKGWWSSFSTVEGHGGPAWPGEDPCGPQKSSQLEFLRSGALEGPFPVPNACMRVDMVFSN